MGLIREPRDPWAGMTASCYTDLAAFDPPPPPHSVRAIGVPWRRTLWFVCCEEDWTPSVFHEHLSGAHALSPEDANKVILRALIVQRARVQEIRLWDTQVSSEGGR